jgi:hypothetical protein
MLMASVVGVALVETIRGRSFAMKGFVFSRGRFVAAGVLAAGMAAAMLHNLWGT